MDDATKAMQRKHQRVIVDMMIEVSLLPSDDSADTDISTFSCTGRDISGGGISFYGDVLYSEYSLLRLQIPLQTTDANDHEQLEMIKVMGKVMWSRKKKHEDSGYATGVQFLNIYENDFKLLDEYVKKQQIV